MEQLKQKKERHKISSEIKGLLYSGVKRRDHRSFSSEEKKRSEIGKNMLHSNWAPKRCGAFARGYPFKPHNEFSQPILKPRDYCKGYSVYQGNCYDNQSMDPSQNSRIFITTQSSLPNILLPFKKPPNFPPPVAITFRSIHPLWKIFYLRQCLLRSLFFDHLK